MRPYPMTFKVTEDAPNFITGLVVGHTVRIRFGAVL